MTHGFLSLMVLVGMLGDAPTETVSVPLNERKEFEVSVLVESISKAAGANVARPSIRFRLATSGLAGTLVKKMLNEMLGPGVLLASNEKEFTVEIPVDRLKPASRKDWEERLGRLVMRVEQESARRMDYGLYARKSYRPNDPTRPTVCLIHGMNSTSNVFLHMVEPIEEAGYGVVVYDFPYNRDIDETAAAFRKDWQAFREKTGDRRSWAIVAHSMGGLIARSYVESPGFRGDVKSMILIAPVNGGSFLSTAQTILQFVQGMKSINGQTRSDPLTYLGDGLGAAAADLTPGSRFLKELNARTRPEGVAYHILSGDVGFVSGAVSAQLEARLKAIARISGPSILGQLEEITDGLGDGAVAVARTKLAGVEDHVTLHANHLELIRAPLLFPDAGPVISMPYLLRWLKADLPVAPSKRPEGPPSR